VTSPAYILENPNGNTLCIPTVFISMTGEALDNKTPLLRSQQAMAKQAARVLHLFGHENPDAVVSFAGAEQEYFLIDRSFFLHRPDLLNSGRTLFGAKPPKGQEFDDHYFGAIPERVLAYMMDCERELFKLGIPAKTRHNEVAPGQFELAPMFERSNVAADHQQLLMTTLKKVAQKHGMECLFHEKPFEGINGSGKHVNFSSGNSTQGNLLLPGDTPHDNAQFLVFCAAVIRSVHKFGGLLRASVASATNDHRLGANEAPPAIISIFLGDQLADVFEQIAQGGATSSKRRAHSRSGSTPSRAPDRSRAIATAPAPSPSPATGSSSGLPAHCSRSPARWSPSTPSWPRPRPHRHRARERRSPGTPSSTRPCRACWRQIIKDHGAVVFNNDGYADEWQTEAAERGLPNLKTTLDALPELITEESMELFSHYGVFNHREMHSRYEVALEQYILSIHVEAALTLEMANTIILPAALRYQTELAQNLASLSAIGRRSTRGPWTRCQAHSRQLRRASPRCARRSTTTTRHRRKARRARAEGAPPGHGRGAGRRRLSRDLGGRRPVAAPTYQEMLFIL
jgi:glutamine synthetase